MPFVKDHQRLGGADDAHDLNCCRIQREREQGRRRISGQQQTETRMETTSTMPARIQGVWVQRMLQCAWPGALVWGPVKAARALGTGSCGLLIFLAYRTGFLPTSTAWICTLLLARMRVCNEAAV